MQKLLIPFKRSQVICGFKSKNYAKPVKEGGWGYNHWGIDISTYQGYSHKNNDHTIYASGEGTVAFVREDKPLTKDAKSLGIALAIVYKNCISHSGEVKDLCLRYMHCEKVLVKEGDKVFLGTPIAVEGNIGATNYHLHLEVDYDTVNVRYTPQVSYGHSAWIKQDNPNYFHMTVNPSLWLYQNDEYVQDEDQLVKEGWINPEDENYPKAETDNVSELQKEVRKLKYDLTTTTNKLKAVLDLLEDIITQYK